MPQGLRFYSPDVWPTLTVFDGDTSRVEAEPNSIITHPLVRYYENGWAA